MGIVVAPDNDDMGGEGDGLPTMGEQYETELQEMAPWNCFCGQPDIPGVLHRTDGPCYHIDNKQRGINDDPL